jgi:hypothetical protein
VAEVESVIDEEMNADVGGADENAAEASVLGSAQTTNDVVM